jgi:hypothetical protein
MKIPKIFKVRVSEKPLCGTRVKEAMETLKAVTNGKGKLNASVKPTR